MQPAGKFSDFIIARGWVPMDDEHMMFIVIHRKAGDLGHQGAPIVGLSHEYEFQPNGTDWYGRWRLVANADNDARINWKLQRLWMGNPSPWFNIWNADYDDNDGGDDNGHVYQPVPSKAEMFLYGTT